jgi:endonuclease/exonuclease/phosphatase family metal-dependent hydrolase
MADTFISAGQGFGHTFFSTPVPMRIDYVFVGRWFRTIAHKVVPTGGLTDHAALRVVIRLKVLDVDL